MASIQEPDESTRGKRRLTEWFAGRTFALLSLVLVMLVWGSAFAVTKASVVQVPPICFALLRFGIASLVLVPLACSQGGMLPLPRSLPLVTLVLMGLTGITLYYIGFNVSLLYTTASQGALIQSSIPAVTAVIAIGLLGERLSAWRMLGIGISILGVLLVVTINSPGTNAARPLLGNLLMLGTVIVWSLYTVLIKRLASAPQLAVTAYSTLFGTLLLIPAALVELRVKPAPMLTRDVWISALYLGVLGSAGGYLLWNRALTYLDASQAATFVNLLPVIGVTTAVLFLDEPLVSQHLVGGALVLLGVWLSSR